MKNIKSILKVSSALLILSVILATIPAPAYAEDYYSDDDYFTDDEYYTDDDYYSDDYYDEQFFKDFTALIGGEYTYSYLYGIRRNEWLVLSNDEKAEYQVIYDEWLEGIKKKAREESLARDPSGLLLDYDIELAVQQALFELYFEWRQSLPYSEQMEIINHDWAIQAEWEQAAQKRIAAEAAAKAAAPIKLVVNGRNVATDSPPVIDDGRTLAPVRAIVEALGYTVAWDSGIQTLDVYDTDTHDHRISMKIGRAGLKYQPAYTVLWTKGH